MSTTTPKVSVIVSTRNRPDDAVACVKTILANQYPAFELLVIDQSPQAEQQRAAAAVGPDQRLRWISTATRGLSVSRNLAVAAARAPILAFTDDDCRVSETWVADTTAEFDADPELALLFGRVVLLPEDRARGYAAEFEPEQRHELRGALPEPHHAWGVGANMAFRRAVFDKVGVFDTVLGAGAPFFAGEELDLTLRALAAGFKLAHTPSTSVVHLGVREGAEAGRLLRGYGIGLGATLGKHLRLGTHGAARLLAGWLALHGRRVVGNALRGDRHPGFGLVAAVLLGVGRSYRQGLDRGRSLYRE
jgi:GT2 family glycosyltransferase